MNRESVRELVESHRGDDDVESDYRRQLLDLVMSVEDPWKRDRYEPGHLTASAFVLHPVEPAMALIHHAKLGLWLQPGGHVEATDDSHLDAALREVAEECGITEPEVLGVIDLDIHVFPSRADTPSHLHFDLRWAVRSHTVALEAGDGATGARWVPLSEVSGMDESLARSARKLLSGWAGLWPRAE
jgi:8-oxo-dGTP pyrophosphatase MutT (NUDIX family)